MNEQFDNIVNGVPFGWNEVLNPNAFFVLNNQYFVTVPTVIPNEDSSLSYITNQNWTVNSLEVDVTGLSGPDRFLLFRYDYSRPTRKGYVFKWYQDFYMTKVEMWGLSDGKCEKIIFYDNELGVLDKIKIEAHENNFYFFMNGSLLLQCYDSEPILDGGVGIFLHASGSLDEYNQWYTNSVKYDNFLVKGSLGNNLFNLPVNYLNRMSPGDEEFRTAFWKRMTASFDHNKLGNRFQPFTSVIYNKKDCPSGTVGISCYDSHNGTDFRPLKNKNHHENDDYDILPVADGTVVYVSDTSSNGKCMTSKNSYGCVVIIDHHYDNLYTLYAHMSQINVGVGEDVNFSDIIGKMGNTGCSPRCGIHLHLGVLKDKTPDTSLNTLSSSDWEDVLQKSQPLVSGQSDAPPKHYCTYKTPDGNILSFQDPSGWPLSINDPWEMTTSEGGCGTESPYLWMRFIGENNADLSLEKYFLEL